LKPLWQASGFGFLDVGFFAFGLAGGDWEGGELGDDVTGGGEGEEMFRSMMVDQYAKGIEGQGGFGIASQMKAELLKHQQAALPQAAAQ